MSNYSDPITATGSLITFDAPSGGVFDSLSVPITPTQDLHGYSSPWPAGGGKNLFDATDSVISGYVSNTGTWVSGAANEKSAISGLLQPGTYTISKISSTRFRVGLCDSKPTDNEDLYTSAYWTASPQRATSLTITTQTAGYLAIFMYNGSSEAHTADEIANSIQIESGSSATAWAPYSNICPITGRTGLSVYVSPTQDQQDATTYSVDWTSEAGTVYGGTLDVVTGVLTVDRVCETITKDSAWTSFYTGTGNSSAGVYLQYYQNCKYVDGSASSNGAICSTGEEVPNYWTGPRQNESPGGLDMCFAYSYTGLLRFHRTDVASITDLNAFKAAFPNTQICYYLATPLTYQLTPTQISMLVGGQNNVWVDTSAVITMIYRLLQVDRQTGATSIGRLAQNLLIANQFGAYSKVIINVTEELYYEAGNDTGRTFELSCPFGTQAMANNILAMLEGFQYQPYTAERAILDPAAELGDGVTVNGVYGGIFRISIKSGAVYNADVSAPADEEIDHEYAFIPNAERKIERRINNLSSELLVQADQISAKVSQTGGNSSSFSWQLLSSGFLLNSGNKTVFQANSSGITVTGQMNATSGYIGDGANGFLISSRSISNGKSGLSDSNNGVYIGTDGIALGPNFKVDSSGNLTANSGTFTGSVYANKVQAGGNAGYITGGQIGSRAISVGKCSTGINTSLGNADYSADVFSGAVRANYTKANNLFAYGTFDVEGTFLYKGVTVKLITRNVKDSNGNTVTIKYIGSI